MPVGTIGKHRNSSSIEYARSIRRNVSPRQWKKPVKLFILIVLITAVLASALVFWVIRRPFPRYRGQFQMSGLGTEVEIFRDSDGVPHIFADSMEDVMFAQGFVHAQDRFWQMEFWRRTGQGRLSEVFGEDLLTTDMYLRTLGFAEVAAREYERLEEPYKSWLDSYARGVNGYISERRPGQLGLEFAVLGLIGTELEIEPWTGVHSLTWAKMMALDLSQNMSREARNLRIIRDGGQQLLNAFISEYREDMPVIVSPEELENFRRQWGVDPRQFLNDDGSAGPAEEISLYSGFQGIGSNNWAVSGSLSRSGSALISNDMHLGVQMPSIWYEIGMHINPSSPSGEEYDVRGYSFAGVPGIISGQNRHIAWGITNVGGDVQDYSLEKIDPGNRNRYLDEEGNWKTMTLRDEVIRVRDRDEPVFLTVRSTDRGPVVSDLPFLSDLGSYDISPDEQFPRRVAPRVVSLSWTALRPTAMFRSVMNVNRAGSMEEFRNALRDWDVPGQNFVYGDGEGNIGYQTTGKHPLRSSHEGRSPAVPSAGEKWEGTVPFDMMPGLYNPDRGFIVSANNPVADSGYEFLIGSEFANGYRALQIENRLNELGNTIEIDDLKSVHADVYSLHAKEFVVQMLEADAETAADGYAKYEEWISSQNGTRDAADTSEKKLRSLESLVEDVLDLWRNWDFTMEADSPQALAYAYVWRELILNTMEDEFPPPGSVRGSISDYESFFHILFSDPDHRFWDYRPSDGAENMKDIISRSLAEGVSKAAEEHGMNPDKWKWGDVHGVEFRNATLGESGIPVVERLFNRGPFPVPGHGSTVNVTHWSLNRPFDVTSIASQRSILDAGNPDNSLFIHPGGQSGHPFHRHYDDYIPVWVNVEYHPGRFSRGAVEADAGSRLIQLLPE